MPSTAQPAPETDEKKSRGLGSYLVWAFVAVMLYVLSSGPVELLHQKGILNANFLILYRPVAYAYFATPLHKPIGIYLHLWCPSAYDAKGDPSERLSQREWH